MIRMVRGRRRPAHCRFLADSLSVMAYDVGMIVHNLLTKLGSFGKMTIK